MAFNLFVGDVYEDLAKTAQSFDPTAYLLTLENATLFIESNREQTAYTSLADLQNIKLFDRLCAKADAIFYHPPDQWSDTVRGFSRQKNLIESVLSFYTQHNKVYNADRLDSTYDFFAQDFLQDQRKTNDRQFWAVGCSVTAGLGIEDHECWKSIVQQKLNLPMSDLSEESASITWASDQIVRSDIRAGDIVFWQLTSQNRIPLMHQKQTLHLTAARYKFDKKLDKTFPMALINDSESLFWHNILAIRRASNFCKKVDAKLIILSVGNDFNNLYRYYNVPNFFQLIYHPNTFEDRAMDNMHPGPKSHQTIAEKFLELYKEIYQ